jgi:hypothetical protein
MPPICNISALKRKDEGEDLENMIIVIKTQKEINSILSQLKIIKEQDNRDIGQSGYD